MNRREQRISVDGIDFGSIFQFQTICGAIASSLQPARIIIGFGMVVVLIATGRIWDSGAGDDAMNLNQSTNIEALQQGRALAIAQSATALGNIAPDDSENWSVQDAQTHLITAWKDYKYEGDVSEEDQTEFERMYRTLEEIRPRGPFEASTMFVSNAWTSIVNAGLNLEPVAMWNGVVAIVWELPQHLWQGGFHWFISLYGFLLIYVLCIGGGAIARMQACGHARALRLSIRESLDFSIVRWRALLIALTGPAMFVSAITIMLMIMGLVLLNIPWLNLLGGLLYGFALLLGLLIAVIAVGYAFCFPMLIPAVVVEDCNGGEAIQRSYAYLLSRTLHVVGYMIVLVISLVVGFLVVRLIATITLDLTASLVDVWLFNSSLQNTIVLRDSEIPVFSVTWYESAAGNCINFWETVVHNVMYGWLFSGFFSTSTMLYLSMRKTCDGQDTQDIWWKGLIKGTNISND